MLPLSYLANSKAALLQRVPDCKGLTVDLGRLYMLELHFFTCASLHQYLLSTYYVPQIWFSLLANRKCYTQAGLEGSFTW